MTPTQLVFFVVLPLAIAVVGLIYGEVFRARQMRYPEQSAIYQTSVVNTPPNSGWEHFVQLTPREKAFQFWMQKRYPYLIKKLGNTPVATLRRVYGRDFAPGLDDDERLADVLYRLDKGSFDRLVRDDETGKLDQIL
jgi:hypothetical protein